MVEKEAKDKEMEAIKKLDANPACEILTKEKYESLMGGAKPKNTSTPRIPLTPKTPKVPFFPQELLVQLQQDCNSSLIQQTRCLLLYLHIILQNYPFSVVLMNQERENKVMGFGVMR